jgi:predicted amidohydrolase YtcJ
LLPRFLHIIIRDGLIAEIRETENSSVIEVNGNKTVYPNFKIMPSFVDSHCHFHGLGLVLQGLTLNNCQSAEECAYKAYISPSFRGDWIFGLGWNKSIWKNNQFPHKSILDSVIPDVPVFLKNVDAHAAWLNSKALNLLNITANSLSPEGGEILKDSEGEPTGILLDRAMWDAEAQIPQFTYEQFASQIERSQSELAKVGITEVHDMDLETEFIPMMQKLENSNKLYIKSRAYFRVNSLNFIDDFIQTKNNRFFKIAGIKLFMDGALGSCGAALSTRYLNSDSEGLIFHNPDYYHEVISEAVKHKLNIATHAIGDRAVSMILEIYKEYAKSNPDLHFRIEHLQLLKETDLRKWLEKNIIPSVQPLHYYSDLDSVFFDRIAPESIDYAYPWKTLLDKNLRLISGSDFPIDQHNPQLGIKAYLNRLTPKSQVLNPSEAISFSEAIASYTVSPRALFYTHPLSIGSPADFIVLNEDHSDKNNFFEIIATYSSGTKIFHT